MDPHGLKRLSIIKVNASNGSTKSFTAYRILIKKEYWIFLRARVARNY